MRRFPLRFFAATLASIVCVPSTINAAATQDADPRLEAMKVEVLELVEGRAKLVQEIVDQLFSFGELGFQEFETQRYLTGLLADNGFEIELGVAGMPSAWTARWGSGRPVIALGSDVDGIPQSNQKPGVGYREPILSMAPGHGEGHNSGQAVNIAAALAVKDQPNPGKAVIVALCRLLEDEEHDPRWRAAVALAQLAVPESREALNMDFPGHLAS